MKYLILFFICAFAVSAQGQITLEHTYPHSGFGLVEVDSGVWKYVQTNLRDTIALYNLDHSLDRIIKIPWVSPNPDYGSTLLVIAKKLFDLDDTYAYLLISGDTNGRNILLIFKEDGSLLFSCDTCQLDGEINLIGYQYGFPSAIQATSAGTKMIVLKGYPANPEVYSLPGKLPGCSTSTLGVTNPSIAGSDPSLPTSAYPNPSNGRVHITYELPVGVSTGEIVLLTEDGKEVKRYQVTGAFNDLLIEESDLPSGSYFYKLVTNKGESPAKRIVWLK